MRDALNKTHLQAVYDSVASYYDTFHSWGTLRSDIRGRRLVVAQGVRSGDFVLDAGGGTGITSIMAAKKVGPKGKVVVFDMSKGMLERAKEKARQEGLMDRMSFKTGDILNLPYKDGRFDAVISTYSLCPLYDPQQGALELYRVVKPGGRFVAAHSTDSNNILVRWLAQRIEGLTWRFPLLTLGCRPVSVLPALKKAGAKLMYEHRIGIALHHFHIFVVQKPKARSKSRAS